MSVVSTSDTQASDALSPNRGYNSGTYESGDGYNSPTSRRAPQAESGVLMLPAPLAAGLPQRMMGRDNRDSSPSSMSRSGEDVYVHTPQESSSHARLIQSGTGGGEYSSVGMSDEQYTGSPVTMSPGDYSTGDRWNNPTSSPVGSGVRHGTVPTSMYAETTQSPYRYSQPAAAHYDGQGYAHRSVDHDTEEDVASPVTSSRSAARGVSLVDPGPVRAGERKVPRPSSRRVTQQSPVPPPKPQSQPQQQQQQYQQQQQQQSSREQRSSRVPVSGPPPGAASPVYQSGRGYDYSNSGQR